MTTIILPTKNNSIRKKILKLTEKEIRCGHVAALIGSLAAALSWRHLCVTQFTKQNYSRVHSLAAAGEEMTGVKQFEVQQFLFV